jgi:hypothetical protein
MTKSPIDTVQIGRVIARAKVVARRYRALTGKPLGITGEVAEWEAARLLGLTLAPARQTGFDATEVRVGRRYRLQIKGRSIRGKGSPGERTPAFSLKKSWHAALLVILDENLEPKEIHRATRSAVEKALRRPGSKARNERGQLGVRQFICIARRVWHAG